MDCRKLFWGGSHNPLTIHIAEFAFGVGSPSTLRKPLPQISASRLRVWGSCVLDGNWMAQESVRMIAGEGLKDQMTVTEGLRRRSLLASKMPPSSTRSSTVAPSTKSANANDAASDTP